MGVVAGGGVELLVSKVERSGPEHIFKRCVRIERHLTLKAVVEYGGDLGKVEGLCLLFKDGCKGHDLVEAHIELPCTRGVYRAEYLLELGKHLVDERFNACVGIELIRRREQEALERIAAFARRVLRNLGDERMLRYKALSGDQQGKELVRIVDEALLHKLVCHSLECQTLRKLNGDGLLGRIALAYHIDYLLNAHVLGKHIGACLKAVGLADEVDIDLEHRLVGDKPLLPLAAGLVKYLGDGGCAAAGRYLYHHRGSVVGVDGH